MRIVAGLITSLGDAALLLPATAVWSVYLVRERSWRAAAGWIAALALCVGLTAMAKTIFYACNSQFPALAIRSPSGHASLSATFYGCGALMLSADRYWWWRLVGLLTGAALVLAIAASRVALHAHTVEEVGAGLAIGLFCVGFYAALCLPRALGALGWRLPVVVVILLALLTHGRHLSIEGFLDRLSDHLWPVQYVCPTREDLALKTVTADRPAA